MKISAHVTRVLAAVGIASVAILLALALGARDLFWPSMIAISLGIAYSGAISAMPGMAIGSACAAIAVVGYNYYIVHSADGFRAAWILVAGVVLAVASRFLRPKILGS